MLFVASDGGEECGIRFKVPDIFILIDLLGRGQDGKLLR